jgi:TRAP-type C4-dicarboxylate transport system substrate-binding protein
MGRGFAVGVVLLVAASAAAEPVRLRMAAAIPDGTSYAREMTIFSREVAEATAGNVQVKWYFGGIAGDDVEVLDRIKRGQLDGAASSLSCSRLAPSMRVTRILGLFRGRDEFRHVLAKLAPTIQREMLKAGFAHLGTGTFGNVVILSRKPIRSLADLRASRMFTWKLDEVWAKLAPEIGINAVPLPTDEAGRAWDDGKLDGFFAFPGAALAFQWSARARYFTELDIAMLPGCIFVASRTFDALPVRQQEAIREAGARLNMRFDERGSTDDKALLGGLFEKQGLKRIPASEAFKSEFHQAALTARDHLGPQLVPEALIGQVLGWLADYRAQAGPR